MSFSDAHPHQCPKLQFYHQQSQTRMIKCSRSEMVSDVLFNLFPYEKNYITKQNRFFFHSFFNCAIYMFPIKLLTYKYPYVFSLHRWSRTEAWKSCLRLSMENRFCTSECINVKCWERDFSLIQLITKSTWSTLYMSMRKAVSTAELFNQLWEKTAAGHEPLCVSRLYCDGPS